MTLKEYIHTYCKKNRISVKKLAENANMPRSSLYNLMDQKKSTTLVNLSKLAVAMQVHPYYLIKLEWQKYMSHENFATPLKPLIESERWFTSLKESSHFVSETVPDGSIVHTGEVFTKTWRVQNTGNDTWENCWLVCKSKQTNVAQEIQPEHLQGKNLCLIPTVEKIAIPTINAGETVDLSVEFTAPDVPAMVLSYWKMEDSEGNESFPENMGIYAQVQVVDFQGAKK